MIDAAPEGAWPSKVAGGAGDLDTCSAGELSELVLAGAAAAEAAQVALVQMIGVWDARQAWALDHALSAVPWLTHRTGCSRAEAACLVRNARLARNEPTVGAAVAAGELTTTQLGLLASAAGQGRERLFADHVATLLDFARTLNHHDFTRVVRRWRELADDELGRTDPAARDAQEHVRLDETLDAKWRLSGLVDAELAALLQACLDRYDQPDPADTETPRTRAQRDVDNLRSILRDVMGGPTGQPNVTVTAVIDLDLLDPPATTATTATTGITGITGTTGTTGTTGAEPWRSKLPRLDGRCRIDGLGDVERHTLDRLLCTSRLNRVILRGGSCVLDYGRRARLFSDAQRRAILIRDGFHCAVTGCHRTDLDVHHLHDYDHGGPTDLANGAALCHRHHTLVHRDKLTATWNADGGLDLTTPLRI